MIQEHLFTPPSHDGSVLNELSRELITRARNKAYALSDQHLDKIKNPNFNFGSSMDINSRSEQYHNNKGELLKRSSLNKYFSGPSRDVLDKAHHAIAIKKENQARSFNDKLNGYNIRIHKETGWRMTPGEDRRLSHIGAQRIKEYHKFKSGLRSKFGNRSLKKYELFPFNKETGRMGYNKLRRVTHEDYEPVNEISNDLIRRAASKALSLSNKAREDADVFKQHADFARKYGNTRTARMFERNRNDAFKYSDMKEKQHNRLRKAADYRAAMEKAMQGRYNTGALGREPLPALPATYNLDKRGKAGRTSTGSTPYFGGNQQVGAHDKFNNFTRRHRLAGENGDVSGLFYDYSK